MPRNLTPTQAREMSAARRTKAGPRGVTMPCGWCGQPLTAREIRAHFTACPLRPARETDAPEQRR